MKRAYALYLALVFVFIAGILIAPLAALFGQQEVAAFAYNIYAPTCHQWIYRSNCVFSDGAGMWIADCIDKNERASISTEFTTVGANKRWDGVFTYSRDQIGINRAEKVVYENGVVGYKFANDTRNIGVYIFMLLGGITLPFVWKQPKVPHVVYFALAILPLAIDGTGQLFGLWESTNVIRFLTGAVAGAGVAVFVYALIKRVKK